MGSVFEIALHDVSKMFLGGSPNIPATTMYGIHASHQVACKVEYILFKYSAQYLKKKTPSKVEYLRLLLLPKYLITTISLGTYRGPLLSLVSCFVWCAAFPVSL